MSAIADGIELFFLIMERDSSSKPALDRSSVNAASGILYCISAFCWLVVWTKYSNQHFSACLTASAMVQALGFLLLTLKVRGTKSVAGISSNTIQLYAATLCFRLCATCFNPGYLPADKSGKFVYQSMDFASLVLALQLLYCVHKTQKWSYQADQDSMPAAPLLTPCVVLGYFVHARLARNFVLDVCWAVSLWTETVALMPQLWMLTKIGGKVEGLPSGHFVAAMCASRGLSLWFWYSVYVEKSQAGHMDLSSAEILAAHGVQFLLAADFLYYYLRGKYSGEGTVLPDSPELDTLGDSDSAHMNI